MACHRSCHHAAIAHGPGSAASLPAAPAPRPAPLCRSAQTRAAQTPGPSDRRLLVRTLPTLEESGSGRKPAKRIRATFQFSCCHSSSVLGAFPQQKKMQRKRWCVCVSSGCGKQCAQGTVSTGRRRLLFLHWGCTCAGRTISPNRRGPREVMSIRPFPQGEPRDQKHSLHFSRVSVPYSCLDGGRSHRPPKERFPHLALCRCLMSAHTWAIQWTKLFLSCPSKNTIPFLLTTVPISALGDLTVVPAAVLLVLLISVILGQ